MLQRQSGFHGHRVLAATFVLAIFGWGVGFYGPPIFLHAVVARTQWTVPMVSGAVTLHFLVGALVVARLPRLYGAWGVPATTSAGALVSAIGTCGWALAQTPWQLYAAAAVSGAGWVAMGAAAVNALISPWFVARRPRALATAYNGASIGGVVFAPLWVALIGTLGFAGAAMIVGIVMVACIGALSLRVFSRTPEQLGQFPDGQAAGTSSTAVDTRAAPLAARPWRDKRFVTLAAGMALGLFAQIGLLAHLYSALAQLLDERLAGIAMALATACAIAGRSVAARVMPAHGDRRMIACASYAVQATGSVVLWLADGSAAWLWLGVVLFGAGIGNATSIPPLVAQSEFTPADTRRVVPWIVAWAQGCYAWAPACFGMVLAYAGAGHASLALFGGVALVQIAAIACLAAGRTRVAINCRSPRHRPW